MARVQVDNLVLGNLVMHDHTDYPTLAGPNTFAGPSTGGAIGTPWLFWTTAISAAATTITGINTFTTTTVFNGVQLNVRVEAASYLLTDEDDVVIFTDTATATLPAATGSGQTYRIANEGTGTVTIDADSTDTIKGAATQTIAPGEDLIITDYMSGKWA